MKFRKKATLLLFSLCIFICILGILLGSTFALRGETLQNFYQSYIARAVSRNLTVTDRNGIPIYAETFSDDTAMRLATFHLIGDRNGSLPDSLLTRTAKEAAEGTRWSGYKGEKKSVRLTIDAELQLAAWETLQETGLDGCIAVVDYKTGELLAMVSSASVDVLSSDEPAPEAYLNKTLCAYAPGSVFKSVTVAAILEKGSDTTAFSYTCTGEDGDIRCLGIHGTVNLSEALYKSCNCAIAKAAGQYLTPAELNEFTQQCGILSPSLLSGISAQRGQIDADDHFGWSASGQSKTLLTPLAVASYYSAIADGGILHPITYFKSNETVKTSRIFSQETAAFLKSSLTTGMTEWYHSPIPCESFGKTGTAEVDGAEPHSWFVCSLTDPYSPTYTIVTFLKNGGNSITARTATSSFLNRGLFCRP